MANNFDELATENGFTLERLPPLKIETIPDYEAITRVYRRACEGNAEPSLMVLRPIRRTKAVRRKVGRLLRRGSVIKGEVLWPCVMKNDFGALVV